MVAFGNISLNLSPNRISSDIEGNRGQPRMPVPFSRPLQAIPSRNPQTSPTPRRDSGDRIRNPTESGGHNSAEPSQRSRRHIYTTTQLPDSQHATPLRGEAVAIQSVQSPRHGQQCPPAAVSATLPSQRTPSSYPQPIYPLQPGGLVPRSDRTFDRHRAHGYYVVFVGPRLGIFHEYWCVSSLLSLDIHLTTYNV